MNVAPKIPIGRLADSAINSLKNPLETAGKVVEQAKGTAAFGKMMASQAGRSAVSKAAGTAGAVVNKASTLTSGSQESSEAAGDDPSSPLRPVPEVNEPAHTTEPLAERAEESSKQHGDPMRKPAKKTAAKKTAAPSRPVPSPKVVAEVVEAAVAEDPSKTAATPVKKSEATQAAKKAPAKTAAPGDRLPPPKAAKKVASESATLRKAAEKNPE